MTTTTRNRISFIGPLALVCVFAATAGCRHPAREAVAAQPPAAGGGRGAAPPARAYFKEFALGEPASGPSILAVDDDDAIWVALAKSSKLARFSNGLLETFPFDATSRPVGLSIPPRGNPQYGSIWISAGYDNKIIRFDRATKAKQEFPIGGTNSWPFNIATAPDGHVWFTQRFAGRIGELDPSKGTITQHELTNRACGPAGLAIDRASGAVWFTEGFCDTVARLDPKTGAVKEWKLSEQSTGVVSGPAGIAIDAAGGVWFAKLEGALGHIAPGSAQADVRPTPKEARRPAGIAVAQNGQVWTLALDGNAAIRFDPASGAFATFPLPTGGADEEPRTPPEARTSRPFGIGFDHQGNLWFTEQYTGKLGVIDLAAPDIRVVSPGSVVEGGRALISVQVSDRVAGGERVAYELDGEPIVPRQGFVDLLSLRPGKHRLSVAATDGAGLTGRVDSVFDYQPGRYALEYGLRRLEPFDAAGEQAKKDLLAMSASIGEEDARSKVAALRTRLAEVKDHFRPFPIAAYASMMEFTIAHKLGRMDVRVLDEKPYFDKPEISIRAGDAVRWRYESSSNGHSAGPGKQNLRIEAGGRVIWSRVLASGDNVEYRFDAPGLFVAHSSDAPESALSVRVGTQ